MLHFKKARGPGSSPKEPFAVEYLLTGCADTMLLDKSTLLGSGQVMEVKSFQSFSHMDTANRPGTSYEQVVED